MSPYTSACSAAARGHNEVVCTKYVFRAEPVQGFVGNTYRVIVLPSAFLSIHAKKHFVNFATEVQYLYRPTDSVQVSVQPILPQWLQNPNP